MKICSKCLNEKDLKEFNKNKSKTDGLQSQCKLCRKKSTKKSYENNKQDQKDRVKKRNLQKKIEVENFIIEYLKLHPCVDCGEKDIVVLEFDHIKNKKYNVGDMMRARLKLDSIKEEIEKCEVRCANCHRRKTSKDRNYYRCKIS